MGAPRQYEKDFDAVVTFHTQYIDKGAPAPSVKVASVAETRSSKRQETNADQALFTGKINLNKYSREEYDLMLMAQQQQLYKLCKKAGLMKCK